MSVKVAFVVFTLFVCGAYSRPQLNCKGKADGVYGDPVDSRGYYVCLEEEEIAQLICGEGKHFDPATKGCISDNDAENQKNEGEVKKLAEEEDEELDSLKSEIIKLIQREDNAPNNNGTEENRPNGISKYKVYNVVLSKNIFPSSLIIIGKANREQKNK